MLGNCPRPHFQIDVTLFSFTWVEMANKGEMNVMKAIELFFCPAWLGWFHPRKDDRNVPWAVCCYDLITKEMSRNDRKRTIGNVRPAKIQISLRIRAVCSESSLWAFRIAMQSIFSRTTETLISLRIVGLTCQMVRFRPLRLKYTYQYRIFRIYVWRLLSLNVLN